MYCMADYEEITPGGVTSPAGFEAGVAACGIKKAGARKPDLMILRSTVPCISAATFTSNQVKAAPVQVSMKHLAQGHVQAAIVNSGNANACNGQQGLDDAAEMAQLAAKALGLSKQQVFVESTGVIGTPMPMERLRPQIPIAASLSIDPLPPAQAIMTSDTVPKQLARRFDLDGYAISLGGMAKGAGMICPNMATMLCFITTDAAIDAACLQTLTRRAVEHSFNRITIEGDMSTNDSVLVLANGRAGNPPITDPDSPAGTLFYHHLHAVALYLAKMIIRDAEKATRFIELRVRGAKSDGDAHVVAKAVANSVLVKCAWNAGQPYWGRIMHAIGYAGVPIEETSISIDFNGVAATRQGTSAGSSIEAMREACDQDEVIIDIDLSLGEGQTTVYTSDISENFVEFNLLD